MLSLAVCVWFHLIEFPTCQCLNDGRAISSTPPYVFVIIRLIKSEALFNIYSLLKQNITSYRVMLSGEDNENGEKTTTGLTGKEKQLCTCSIFFCTFLWRCFARLQLPNYTFTRFMEEMSYAFLFTLFSLPLIFTLKAASISHFLTVTTKFSCCSSNKICLLCFFFYFLL